jgi:hypothetical protein
MTDKNLTYITGIMDRSGSMIAIKDDTEGGWAALIKDQIGQPGQCWVSLVEFDTEHDLVYDYTPIHAVPAYTLRPRGGTALLDAIGFTVNRLGEKLAAIPEDERPGSVVVVILTDGYENSSHEFDPAQIKDMIERQQRDYNWVFQFLGANQDAVTTARGMGIASTHAMTYTGANVGQTFAASSSNVASYRTATAQGKSHTDSVLLSSFTDEQRAEAVDEKPAKPKKSKTVGK